MRSLTAEAWQNYRKELLRFVSTRVADRDKAEDIVQEVMLKAYLHQRELKSTGKLRAWLYQITRNALVDFYRTQKTAQPLPPHYEAAEPAYDREMEKALTRCLKPLLQELAKPYREALTMADFEGLPQQEIASRMSLSLSGAKSRVQRARKMLRAAFFDCCRIELDRRGGVIDYQYRKSGICDGCG